MTFYRYILALALLITPITAQTLPTAAPIPLPVWNSFADNTGYSPLAGGYVCTFAAGTNTPQATYTDSTGGTPNSNPIVLDSAGRGAIYGAPQLYKLVVYQGGNGACPGTGTVVWSADYVGDVSLYLANYVKTVGTASLVSYTYPGTGAISRTMLSALSDFPSVQDFGATCNGVTNDTASFNTMFSAITTRAVVRGCPGTLITPSGLVAPLQALQPALHKVAQFGQYIQSVGSALTLETPDVFMSRLDSTPGSTCVGGQLDACESPMFRMAMQNLNTTTMSTQGGILISGSGYAANTQSSTGNVVIALGIQTYDASTPNVVTLRGENINVGVNSVPNQTHISIFNRSVYGSEIDVVNQTLTDACWIQASSCGGVPGNYLGGMSIVAAGTANSTVGLAIGSSAVTGKGFLTAINIATFAKVGLLFESSATSATSTAAMQIASASPLGMVCGSGSVTQLVNGAGDSLSNPTGDCILLDVKGTYPVTTATNSNILAWRSVDSGGVQHNWRAFSTNSAQLVFSYDNTNEMIISPTFINFPGNITIQGNYILGTGGSGSISVGSGTPTAARSWSFPDANGIFADANVTPTIYRSNGTTQPGSQIIMGAGTLSGGSATATFSPSFSGTGNFYCVASDRSQAVGLQVNNLSTSSFTISNGLGSGSDVYSYICAGF